MLRLALAARLDITDEGDWTAARDRVRADRIQFQQAVVNLVRNGVEAAAGRHGAQVSILGRAEADGYRISIEDNGPGVADMKGGISVLLAALEAFETHPDRHGVGWTVLLSPDEEIGSPASAPLLAELGAR